MKRQDMMGTATRAARNIGEQISAVGARQGGGIGALIRSALGSGV